MIDLRPNVGALPASLTVDVGDVLMVNATGGQVRSGAAAVELLGAFRTGVVADDGRVLAPMGAPNTVLLRARRPGLAMIEVLTGDPWHAAGSTHLRITVEPAQPRGRE